MPSVCAAEVGFLHVLLLHARSWAAEAKATAASWRRWPSVGAELLSASECASRLATRWASRAHAREDKSLASTWRGVVGVDSATQREPGHAALVEFTQRGGRRLAQR